MEGESYVGERERTGKEGDSEGRERERRQGTVRTLDIQYYGSERRPKGEGYRDGNGKGSELLSL